MLPIKVGVFDITFVPKTSWHRSIARLAQGRVWFGRKEIVIPSQYRLAFSRAWERIRKRELLRAGYRCELCGSKENLQVHEIWKYDKKRHVQVLVGYRVLCEKCHRAHHSSYLVKIDDIDGVVEHIVSVNMKNGIRIGRVVVSERLYRAYEEWLDNSKICWRIVVKNEPYLEPLQKAADFFLNFWIYKRKHIPLDNFFGSTKNGINYFVQRFSGRLFGFRFSSRF